MKGARIYYTNRPLQIYSFFSFWVFWFLSPFLFFFSFPNRDRCKNASSISELRMRRSLAALLPWSLQAAHKTHCPLYSNPRTRHRQCLGALRRQGLSRLHAGGTSCRILRHTKTFSGPRAVGLEMRVFRGDLKPWTDGAAIGVVEKWYNVRCHTSARLLSIKVWNGNWERSGNNGNVIRRFDRLCQENEIS